MGSPGIVGPPGSVTVFPDQTTPAYQSPGLAGATEFAPEVYVHSEHVNMFMFGQSGRSLVHGASEKLLLIDPPCSVIGFL